MDKERPIIYAENNRLFWDIVRRFIIMLLKQLDKWYGWSTIARK